jgi:transposase
MRSGISLREDFDGERLRRRARQTKDAARLGNVTLQIIGDWVIRVNERGLQGLVNGRAPGQQSRLNDQQRAARAQAIEREPTPYLDGIVRWRLCDLAEWLWEEFRVSVSEQTLSRELRAMGYRKLAARPKHHAQAPQAIEDFEKVSPPQWQKSPLERPEGKV